MKLGFIFDTVMLCDENNDYYAINLNYRLWEDRYLPVFESMVVSTRVKNMVKTEIVQKKGYTIANGNDVVMYPISEYNKITDLFFNRKKIIEQLEKIIDIVDCVIVRLPSPVGNLACDICRRKNKKYAIEMVACAWDGYSHHGHWAGRIVAPYMFFKTKIQCKKAARVLYVTKNFLQKRYPTKGITTNASNVMINKSKDIVLENRITKIKNKQDEYVLGLVGPLELESKGHIVALRALQMLVQKYPNIIIEFLGAGEGNKLRKQVDKMGLKNNVIFKGTLPSGDAVLNWMDTIDILVIPSFQEGLPRVLIEAMSRACPAVGSNAGGISELINSMVIHKKGNYKKLYEDIDKIINDSAFSISLAQENFNNAKEYAKENLDAKRKQFWLNFKNNKN